MDDTSLRALISKVLLLRADLHVMDNYTYMTQQQLKSACAILMKHHMALVEDPFAQMPADDFDIIFRSVALAMQIAATANKQAATRDA